MRFYKWSRLWYITIHCHKSEENFAHSTDFWDFKFWDEYVILCFFSSSFISDMLSKKLYGFHFNVLCILTEPYFMDKGITCRVSLIRNISCWDILSFVLYVYIWIICYSRRTLITWHLNSSILFLCSYFSSWMDYTGFQI